MSGAPLVIGALCAVLLLACGGPSRVLPARTAPLAKRTEYCATFRGAGTGPVCIHPLSAEQVERRELSFRFHYEGSRAVRIERLNGRGGPKPDDDGSVEYRYRYERNGLEEVVGLDRYGDVSERSLYREGQTRLQQVDEWGRAAISSAREHVSQWIERDERGFARSIRFVGLNGEPARSSSGAYEIRYERDALGLERRQCFYDRDRRPMRSRSGVHCVEISRDTFGNESEVRYFDEHGKPLATFDDYQRAAAKADAWGNIVETSWFDAEGTPISGLSRCATVVKHIDARGFQMGADCLDAKRAPSRWREGNSYWRSKPNARGESIETSFFNARGEPVRGAAGYATVRTELDEKGGVLARRYFWENGRAGQRSGPAVVRYERRQDGLVVGEKYFDWTERATTDRGCFGRSWEYDAYRKAVLRTCKNEKGELLGDDNGVALTRYRYDARGLLLEERYFGPDQRPVDSDAGYAVIRYEYDAYGSERRRRHLPLEGAPLELPRMRGVLVRAPFADYNFIPGSREEAISRINRVRQQLLAGVPFEEVAERFGDSRVALKHAGDIGYTDPKRMYSAVRAAVASLKPGEFSEVVELPAGFWVYQRTE